MWNTKCVPFALSIEDRSRINRGSIGRGSIEDRGEKAHGNEEGTGRVEHEVCSLCSSIKGTIRQQIRLEELESSCHHAKTFQKEGPGHLLRNFRHPSVVGSELRCSAAGSMQNSMPLTYESREQRCLPPEMITTSPQAKRIRLSELCILFAASHASICAGMCFRLDQAWSRG